MEKWQNQKYLPNINETSLHIWRVFLTGPSANIQNLKTYLSKDEIERYEKFHFDYHKIRFVAARGILREILGKYANIPAQDIHFSYSEYGKPYLQFPRLSFNISHTDECMLVAIAHHNNEIGIDIERINSQVDCLALAQEFCTHNEFRKLADLSSEEQILAFFRCWTRKEAYVKAIGKGFYYALNQFEVSFLIDEKPKIIKSDNDAHLNIEFVELRPHRDHIAAVFTTKKFEDIQLFDWNSADYSVETINF